MKNNIYSRIINTYRWEILYGRLKLWITEILRLGKAITGI